MANHQIFRKMATVIGLIAITLSCSSTRTVTQVQKGSEKQQPQIAYGDLIVDPESEYIMIPVTLSGDRKQPGFPNISPISSSYEDYRGSGMVGYNMIFYNKTSGESHILLNKKH